MEKQRRIYRRSVFRAFYRALEQHNVDAAKHWRYLFSLSFKERLP